MADVITKKAVDFINQETAQPFFLYFATHDIHVPRVPHPRFAGRSPMGARGDVILQFDWSVGEILAALERRKLAENTLVILTSDNGPVVDDGYRDQAVEKLGGHQPAGPWRGGKYSIWEGGTRIPFILRWPARVKSGTSEALVCLIDCLASFAALNGQELAPGQAPDSVNVLPALLGESKTGRHQLVEHAQTLALRDAAWKYIRAPKAAGSQLYDLTSDPRETNNVIQQVPAKAVEMRGQLEAMQNAAGTRIPVAKPGANP
jgi:arylsulfatase A-like enzyme